MIWFDIKELEDKISNDELSDRDGFNYLMAFFILSAIAVSFATNNTNGWIKLLHCVVSILINIWGLNATYQANLDYDGKDFLKRFFAINWVIGMRLIVIAFIASILIGGIAGIVLAVNGGSYHVVPDYIKDFSALIISSLFSVIFYLLAINSFRTLKPKI